MLANCWRRSRRTEALAGVLLSLTVLTSLVNLKAHAQTTAHSSAIARQTSRPGERRVFHGTISLAVTATDVNHQIFSVDESIPVQKMGPLTLLYPQWEPASHAPTASVAELAGLMIAADGRRIEWRRDLLDTHAFRIVVPRGAKNITLQFQFLSPRATASLREVRVEVPWHRLLLYPAGYALSALPIAAKVTLPSGLRSFTALTAESSEHNSVVFRPTTLDILTDSPLHAGRFWSQHELSRTPSVRLDVLADSADQVTVSRDQEQMLQDVIAQTGTVFGPPPFRRYEMIVTLNDELGVGGVEHREEGENNLPAKYFVDGSHQLMNKDLLIHEYVHAWNGRFRQPADLWSPTLNQPVQDSLLWVYEGQTEFWGRVLTARAGLRSYAETLDRLAMDADLVANRKGRAWKSLEDSTNDPLYMAGHPIAWRDWQRREDYYPEGVLLWLDVEARLREKSRGFVGLDDFAHRFFATSAEVHTVSTYSFEDVCHALNDLAKDDWTAVLRRHLESHEDADALAGLTHAGWRLRYDEEPTETFRQDEAETGVSNLDDSIGLQVRPDGNVRSVVWDGPAFRAGLAPGSKITAVNGQHFTSSLLEQAIERVDVTPLTLTFEVNGVTQTKTVSYDGKLRYPHLERIPGTVDRITPLLQARRTAMQ
jgi:predicted metalloprotease with PDZ domain